MIEKFCILVAGIIIGYAFLILVDLFHDKED